MLLTKDTNVVRQTDATKVDARLENHLGRIDDRNDGKSISVRTKPAFTFTTYSHSSATVTYRPTKTTLYQPRNPGQLERQENWRALASSRDQVTSG